MSWNNVQFQYSYLINSNILPLFSPLAAAADSVRLKRFGGAAGRLSRGVSLGNIVLGGGSGGGGSGGGAGSGSSSSPRPAQRSATAAIPMPASAASTPTREDPPKGTDQAAPDSFDTQKVNPI